MWRVCCLLIGVAGFLTAPTLARNLVFHYMSASLLGICGSFLIVVILLSRLIPKVHFNQIYHPNEFFSSAKDFFLQTWNNKMCSRRMRRQWMRYLIALKAEQMDYQGYQTNEQQ